jgi:hypothetical protein
LVVYRTGCWLLQTACARSTPLFAHPETQLGAGGSVNLGYCDVELGLCAADQRCGAAVRAPSSEGDVESAEKLRRQKEWRDRRSVDAEQAGASRTAGAAQPHGGWDHQHQHAQQVQQVQQDGQRRRGGNRTPPCSWAAADAGSSSGDDDGAGSSVTEVADAEECSICLCGYADGDVLKQLPCRHSFHSSCIDTWLRNHSPTCPLCKHQLWEANPLSVQHALAGYLELLSLRRQQDEARVRRATERQTREHVASAPDVPAPRSPPAPAAVFGGVLSGARAAAAAAAAAAARAEAQAGASGGDFR